MATREVVRESLIVRILAALVWPIKISVVYTFGCIKDVAEGVGMELEAARRRRTRDDWGR